MHRTTLTRTQRTRRTSTGRGRTRALKNWLTRHRTPGGGTHGPGRSACLCDGRDRTRRRSFVHRTRSSLRNNHAWRGRLRRTRNHWCSRTRRSHGSLMRYGSWNRRCDGRRRCNHRSWSLRRHETRRCRNRRRGCDHTRSGGRNRGRCRLLRRRSDHFRPRSGRRRGSFRCRNRGRSGRLSRSCRRGRNYRPRRDGRRCRASRWRHCFFLLRDGFQHISRPGDLRQIDLGLDFFFAAQRTRGSGRRCLRFGRAAEVHPHFFRFMLLERTGMRLLLSHPD
jgi:hypothetical protein